MNESTLGRFDLLRLFLILLLFACSFEIRPLQACLAATPSFIRQVKTDTLSQYVGRFRMSDGSVLLVELQDGELTLRPIFWRAVQVIRRISGDTFGIAERKDRQVTFIRDSTDSVIAVKVTGFGDDGTFPRLKSERVPAELLLTGQAREAARQMIKTDPGGIETFTKIARTLLVRFPSKTPVALSFLIELREHYPRAASVHAALGDAYVASGKRSLAIASYRTAYQLDSANKDALTGLQRLNALPLSTPTLARGWTLPFSLNRVFLKPTAAEIKAVEANWARRDLSVKDVVEVKRGRLNLGYTEAEVRIISHSVRGQKHYGAIIVPAGARAGTSPVILDLKGVSWDYFPLDLANLLSPKFLGKEQGRFIYVVPSFRGEVLQFDGTEYISEGERADSWDGATDDALALLNVALSITPEADAKRICAFGKSRGGSVALLAGIRDRRIGSILDWAGPVDWFVLMGTNGWTQEELVADGLRNRATPKEEGGQFIERFLTKSIAGNRNLPEVRLHMLASSPLYFAERLQRLQIHYGIEDEMVPVVNGRALASVMKRLGRKAPTFEAYFHAGAGHDLDQRLAYSESKKFLLSLLLDDK